MEAKPEAPAADKALERQKAAPGPAMAVDGPLLLFYIQVYHKYLLIQKLTGRGFWEMQFSGF